VKGLIVFHSVGSGKGLTSLNMAKRLLLKYPNKKIFVVTPTSLIGNYHKEINKFNFDFKGNINVTSYLTFINKVNQHKMDPKNQILIIDEAHNFNTLYSNRSIEIGKICADAFKVILLTATPVKNYQHEIVNLLLFISKEPFSKKDAEMKIMSLHDKSDAYKEAVYSEYCKCKISFFKNVDKSSYPSTKEHIIRFRMTINYYNKYYAIQKHILKNLPDMYKNSKDLTYFINGVRRAINKIDDVSPKIEWAQEKIKSEYLLNKKSLVYSSFKDSGINIIKKYLIKNGISYSEISA
jgi:superfamily II DNA or RNA helicase